MSKYTYYYQFEQPGNQYSPGVYRTTYPHGQLRSLATRSWVQGPKGGVQIVGEWWLLPHAKRLGSGYKTQDPRAMKEFTFVKLQAKDYGR